MIIIEIPLYHDFAIGHRHLATFTGINNVGLEYFDISEKEIFTTFEAGVY